MGHHSSDYTVFIFSSAALWVLVTRAMWIEHHPAKCVASSHSHNLAVCPSLSESAICTHARLVCCELSAPGASWPPAGASAGRCAKKGVPLTPALFPSLLNSCEMPCFLISVCLPALGVSAWPCVLPTAHGGTANPPPGRVGEVL